MLTLAGVSPGRYCDGVARRDFLQIGALALGGLAMPQILEAEARAGIRSSHKAIIMVFLAGGPPHLDMVDLKRAAPSEIRGEFRPISTNVPGIEICEHLPRLARIMDKLAVIRSLIGAHGDHSAGQCLTGYTDALSEAQGGRPSLGAILSKLRGRLLGTCPRALGFALRLESGVGEILATQATWA
jgi:hypothetical protein